MNSQYDDVWSTPWWNENDTPSMFDTSLFETAKTLDAAGEIGDACFCLPPSVDASDSDYSYSTRGSPNDLYPDPDYLSPWRPLSPQSAIGLDELAASTLKTEPPDDTTSPGDWGTYYSSPPELERDNSPSLSPAGTNSLHVTMKERITVKRLRGGGGIRKAKQRKESTDSSEKMNRHNLVEKKYRNRLNQQFELLITTLMELGQGGMDGDKDRTLSKSSVLQLARQTMVNLERKNQVLSREVERLNNAACLAKGVMVGRGTAGRVPLV